MAPFFYIFGDGKTERLKNEKTNVALKELNNNNRTYNTRIGENYRKANPAGVELITMIYYQF